jgi:uncharacterized protein
MSVRALLTTAAFIFLLSNLTTFGFTYREKEKRKAAIAAIQVPEAKRTDEQKAAVEAYQSSLENLDIVKRKQRIEKEIKAMRGNWFSVIQHRAGNVFEWQTAGVVEFGLGDALFAMLIGMAFFKAGILSGEKPTRFYVLLAIAGFALGVPILTWHTLAAWRSHWDPEIEGNLFRFYEYGRLTVGLAHLGLVMTIYKLGLLRPVTSRLASVGQMALSNYLLTSILMSLFFNGYGLGKFGALERHQLLYVVFGMWSINLILSPIWLRYYRFGPFEWAWRSLTYWKRQPLRIASEEAPLPEAATVQPTA